MCRGHPNQGNSIICIYGDDRICSRLYCVLDNGCVVQTTSRIKTQHIMRGAKTIDGVIAETWIELEDINPSPDRPHVARGRNQKIRTISDAHAVVCSPGHCVCA